MNAVSKVNPGEHKLEVVKEAPPLAPPPAGSSVPEVVAPAQRRRVSRRVVWMAAVADNALVKAGDLLFAVDPQPY